MFSQEFIQGAVDTLVTFASDILMPLMVGMFFVAVLFRFLVYYTVKRHDWFAKEFDKRIGRYLEVHDPKEPTSFYVMLKRILEKTFYELFEVRERHKRRKPDRIMSLSDRVFLIRQGTAWLIRDTLRRARHFKHSDHHPKLLQVTKNIFQSNPCFNRVFGIIPASGLNDVLNLLPGIFIIAGIFGTFLGIMKALPELGGMDLADPEQTKAVMDAFLLKISFAMSTSILGILLSVVMNFVNTLLSPDKLFVDVVERFENSLDVLWNLSDSNDLPSDIPGFNDNRDPVESVAEAVVNEEISKRQKVRENDSVSPTAIEGEDIDKKNAS